MKLTKRQASQLVSGLGDGDSEITYRSCCLVNAIIKNGASINVIKHSEEFKKYVKYLQDTDGLNDDYTLDSCGTELLTMLIDIKDIQWGIETDDYFCELDNRKHIDEYGEA